MGVDALDEGQLALFPLGYRVLVHVQEEHLAEDQRRPEDVASKEFLHGVPELAQLAVLPRILTRVDLDAG